MFQFLLPFLEMLGMGGAGAAGAGTLAAAAPTVGPTLANAAALGAGTAGASALPVGAMAPLSAGGMLNAATAGAAQAPTGIMGLASKFAPNLTGMGQNLMQGNFKGAGVNAANMLGGENLANMVQNPSWNNLGKIGEGMGNKMAANAVTQGLMGSPQQQPQPVGPGATNNQKVAQAPQQIQENPVLQRMFNNLNSKFQATPMKPWPASPYPKRMSAI
jgi:hypothetical protein